MTEITRLNSSDDSGVGEGGTEGGTEDGTEDLADLSNICWSETTGELRLSVDIVEFVADKTP